MLCAASLLYAERAARAAGESVQCELQVFALPCPLGYKTGVLIVGSDVSVTAADCCKSPMTEVGAGTFCQQY